MESSLTKHDRTLTSIFATPTQATIEWRDVEALMSHLGATKTEGRGSRVRFALNGRKLDMHRPHPGNELRRYAVKDVRDFLTQVGITP